jgi:hypothetical protein
VKWQFTDTTKEDRLDESAGRAFAEADTSDNGKQI